MASKQLTCFCCKDKPQTRQLKNNHTLTLVEFPVEGLDMKTYVEYRVDEIDENGNWLGYLFFSSVHSHAAKFMEKYAVA